MMMRMTIMRGKSVFLLNDVAIHGVRLSCRWGYNNDDVFGDNDEEDEEEEKCDSVERHGDIWGHFIMPVSIWRCWMKWRCGRTSLNRWIYDDNGDDGKKTVFLVRTITNLRFADDIGGLAGKWTIPRSAWKRERKNNWIWENRKRAYQLLKDLTNLKQGETINIQTVQENASQKNERY